MSSLEISLPAQGWNLFSYPVAATRPVTEALLSISDYYTTVYGYESDDPGNPWRIYSKQLDPAFWTLSHLEFGHGYWINVTHPITVQLKGAGSATQVQNTPALPPATYYGPVEAGPGFTPVAGVPVSAWVGDTFCGQGVTREVAGEVMYMVHVEAHCSASGMRIRFHVAERGMVTTVSWDNTTIHRLTLSSSNYVYLPAVIRMP